MTQYLNIHPQNPQQRFIDQVVEIINNGGIVAMPTDTRYVLVCRVDNFDGHMRLRQIRKLDNEHLFSLICSEFSQISEYAMMDSVAFRLMKNILPGAYTVILEGTKNLGRKLCHPKRKTIGIRIPAHNILQAILKKIDSPLIATSLDLPELDEPLAIGYEVFSHLENRIEAVIDSGESFVYESTVIDLSKTPYTVIREGIAKIPW